MKTPRLIILGYSEAAMLISSASKPEISAIISIHGAREFGVEYELQHRLDLSFDDVEVPEPNDIDSLHRAMARKNWNKLNGLNETAPTIDDIQSIIDFAKTIQQIEGTLLCHCFAGISRAPTAAMICLSTWLGPGFEKRSIEYVQKLRPGAVPHRGMLRFADNILGTQLTKSLS